MATTIEIQRKNPFSATITFKEDGVAFNLTGVTVIFTVKLLNDKADNDDAAIIKKTIIDHSNPENGTTTLLLSADDTTVDLGRYKADFRLYQSGVLQKNTETFYIEFVDIVTKSTS
jgi:hypothetical protein